MFRFLLKGKKKEQKPENDKVNETQHKDFQSLKQHMSESNDFLDTALNENFLWMSYFQSLVQMQSLHEHIIRPLKENMQNIKKIEDIADFLGLDNIEFCDDVCEIEEKLMKGYVIFRLREFDSHFGLVFLLNDKSGQRENSDTETEFSVLGPKVGFVENIDINTNILRRLLPTSKLILKEETIGTISKTKVIIAYLEGVANPQNVNTITQRIKEINYDVIADISLIEQVISDNSKSIFPLFMTTERPDRVVVDIANGAIAVLCNGSPAVLTAPSSLRQFLVSPEDYYLPWVVGSLFRMIRIFGVAFSIFATPFYVAILTYHYQMIPKDLLGPLISSRSNVPFPPIIEALFLEITIELLREAGARLPTKVGQTLGIVGGIVIGQAAVEAALTSNILLILVALSALASFTSPIYKMNNTLRFLRFPFILFAALFGMVGITICLWFTLTHLIRLTSLGTPYLVPFYPPRKSFWGDTFVRAPYSKMIKTVDYYRPGAIFRVKGKNVKEKKDIDE
ncbi:spore germination protein [Fictibacillus sp. Mic-4]|uniref:spore germination protein n=1 Tax=Fictibacillus sp. Mic-4 TaxID=3132826 RepID=UPI003CEF98C9